MSARERFARLLGSRWTRITLRIVIAALVLRVMLALLLVPVLDYVASRRGLAFQCRDFELSVLSGRIAVSELVVRERERPPQDREGQLLTVEWAELDLALLRSLFERPTLARAEVDGVRVRVERKRDGSLAWLHALGLDQEPSADAEVPETASNELDFASPVNVDALRVNGVVLELLDRSVEPAFEARIELQARLSRTAPSEHTFELRATSRELFDLARVDARFDGGMRRAHGELSCELAGLRIAPLRERLTELGFEVTGDTGAARCAATLEITPREGSDGDCHARIFIHDAQLEAGGELIAALDALDLQIASLMLEPAARSTLSAAARAPGIAATLGCEGQLELGWPRVGAALVLHAGGVAPKRLEGALNDVGVASKLTNGSFTGQVDVQATFGDDGSVAADATLADLRWFDDGELAALDRLAVRGATLDAGARHLRIESIEIVGTRTRAHRDAQGVLHALGAALVPVARTAAAASSGRGELPELELGQLRWKSGALLLADRSFEPPLEIGIEGLDIEIDRLVLGRPNAEPAQLRVSFSAGELLESLTLEGTLAARPDGLEGELALRGQGLNLNTLRPQLAALGLAPQLENGSFSADLKAHAREEHGALVASLALAKVALRDGELELAALDSLRIDDATFSADSTRWERIELDGARLTASRDVEGLLGACGLRLVATPPAAAAPARSWDDLFALFEPLPAAPATFDEIRLNNVRATWRDEAVSPRVECQLELRAAVSGISPRDDAAPALFDFGARVAGSLDELSARGEARLASGDTFVRGALSARGVRAGNLAAYVPRGVTVELESGTLDARFAFESRLNGERGRELTALIESVDWRDGERPLAKLESAGLHLLSRDPAARMLQVDRSGAAGIEFDLERSTPTTWRGFGIAIDLAQLEPGAPTNATVVTSRLAGPAEDLPTLSVTNFGVTATRIAVRDLTRGEEAAPLIISGMIASPNAALCSPDPRGLGPIEFYVAGAIAPLARECELSLQLTPWTNPAEIELTGSVRGIDGEGLLALAPEFATHIDASNLKAGEFTAHAKGEFKLERKHASVPDFAKPFSGELVVDGVAFRAEPDGEVLAGLQSARIEIARIDPASGAVSLKSIELEQPIGRVRRTAAGIEALGLLVKLPTAVASDVQTPLAEAVSAPATPSEPPDITLGRFTIQGLDFALRDDSVEPPVALALDAFEFEARKLSLRAMASGAPLSFNATVGAQMQAMPVRVESDSLLEGIAGAAVTAMAGDDDGAAALEERALFDEVALAGKLAFAPELEGWATVDVAALELVPFRGLARSFGLEIGDGVLDQDVRVRFQGARGMSVESRSVFSHLSLAEPAGGLIERYLSLPAPLDTVLFLTEDFEGEHKVPVSFRLDENGLSRSAIVSAAAGAAGSVLASAVASSPLRIASTVTDLFGLTGGEEAPPSSRARSLEFETGATALGPRAKEVAARMQAELDDDSDLIVVVSHQFSSADLVRAAELASPALDDCRQLSLRLRRARSQLTRERDELAARARVDYAVGERDSAAKATTRLRALEAELGLTEDALDRVHELLKPGAERKREQRTRLAALAIASDRLARVVQALATAGVSEKRIELRQVRARASADIGRVTCEPKPRTR